MRGNIDVDLIFEIGANEALMFNFFLNAFAKQEPADCFLVNGQHKRIVLNDEVWFRAPVCDLRSYFNKWSDQKIRKTINALESRSLIKSGVLNTQKMDQSKWYSII